jgi:hypothetical protein
MSRGTTAPVGGCLAVAARCLPGFPAPYRGTASSRARGDGQRGSRSSGTRGSRKRCCDGGLAGCAGAWAVPLRSSVRRVAPEAVNENVQIGARSRVIPAGFRPRATSAAQPRARSPHQPTLAACGPPAAPPHRQTRPSARSPSRVIAVPAWAPQRGRCDAGRSAEVSGLALAVGMALAGAAPSTSPPPQGLVRVRLADLEASARIRVQQQLRTVPAACSSWRAVCRGYASWTAVQPSAPVQSLQLIRPGEHQ